MSNADGQAVPLPANEAVWESWVSHVLFAKFGHTPNAYGRRGQKQHGIDFSTFDGDVRLGVQCKFVAQGGKLDIAQIASDIEASRAIDPPIGKFLLYTSASSDTKTIDALDAQKLACRSHGIDFSYFMWRDFEEEVRRYGLFARLYGKTTGNSLSPPTWSPESSVSRPEVVSSTNAQSSPVIAATASQLYSAMLDDVRDCVKTGDMAGAGSMIELILKRKDALSDSELARTYGTAAVLAARAADFDGAAEYWKKAADVDPSEDGSKARRAQYFICIEENQKALDLALHGLTTQPPSVLSATAALISGQRLGRRLEIDGLLSNRLKVERDVVMVRILVAINDGDLKHAQEIANAAASDHSDDTDLMSLRADLELHSVIGGNKKRRTEIIHGKDRNALESAAKLYKIALAGRDPIRERAVWISTATNLVSTLKLLDRYKDAAEVAAEIIKNYGTTVEEIGSLALALAEGGYEQKALDITEHASISDTKLQMARASALMHLRRFGEAITLLEKISTGPISQEIDDVMIDSIGWMLVVARMQKEPTADFSLITKDFIAASQNKLAATCRVFENASHRNMADVSKIYAKQVIQLYEEILDPNYLLFAVDALLTLERNEDALSLLSKNIDLTSPQGGPLEERMAFCLLRLQRFETLTKLLEGISPQASYSSRFDFYRIDLHLSRGDYSAALAAIRTALSTRPNNLRLQSLEVALLLDEGNNADAREKFEAISFDAEAPAGAIKLYIHQASRLSENRKADEIAYRWIRENGNDPDNAAWFLGNFLLNKRPQESNEQLRSVTKQCGVLISSKSHPDKSRWIVVDDRFDERVSDGWYTSRSSQIPNLIGSALGSVIDISAFPGGPFKIERIVPIFEGAFYLIQSRYGKEIPMAPSLYYISLKGDGEEYDFSSIFKMLDDSKDATLNALSVYSKSPIPLAILAQAIHRHPIDMWMALTGGKHSVRAMSGDTATVSRMIEQLDQPPLSLILDPIVVVSWHYFGVLQLIPSISKSLFMSISAVDLIRQKRNELDSKEGKSRSTLSASHENRKYTHTEITAEEITREKETFDQILTWINTHVRLKPVPTEGIAEEHYSRMRREWPSYLADSFQLSANENGTLIADDLGIEVLAASVGIRQAPTAILFRYGLQKQLVEHVDVSRVLYQLAKANYDFVSLRPEDLLPLTDIQNISPAPEIVTLLRYLQSPSLDVRSGLLFVCRYAKMLDDLNASTSLICASITISMSSISRHATRETIRSFATFYIFAERFLSPQSCAPVKDSLNQWWRGHFLSADDLKK